MLTHFQLLELVFFPCLQFGILGISIGGGKEKSSFEEEEESKKETEQITEAISTTIDEQTGTQTTTEETTGETTTELAAKAAVTASEKSTEKGSINEVFQSLDAETQALLQGLVGDLGEGGLQELTASLTGRALSADKDLAGITDPIVTKMRANLEEGLGQSMQRFARSAGGSTQNTIVQQLGLQEASRVEREVADLAATLGLETRQLATEEQAGAVDVAGGLLSQMTGLLKGSSTTRAGESTTDAVRALDQLTETESVEATMSEEQTSTLLETVLTQLSETVSETTMQEIIEAISIAKGTGKTKGSSLGLSLGI